MLHLLPSQVRQPAPLLPLRSGRSRHPSRRPNRGSSSNSFSSSSSNKRLRLPRRMMIWPLRWTSGMMCPHHSHKHPAQPRSQHSQRHSSRSTNHQWHRHTNQSKHSSSSHSSSRRWRCLVRTPGPPVGAAVAAGARAQTVIAVTAAVTAVTMSRLGLPGRQHQPGLPVLSMTLRPSGSKGWMMMTNPCS